MTKALLVLCLLVMIQIAALVEVRTKIDAVLTMLQVNAEVSSKDRLMIRETISQTEKRLQSHIDKEQ